MYKFCIFNPSLMSRVFCGHIMYIMYPASDLKVSPLLSQFLDTFAKLRKVSISFGMSVRPHGTARPPLDGFS